MLAKDTVIAAAGGNVECTICREPILNYAVVGLIYLSVPSRHNFFLSNRALYQQHYAHRLIAMPFRI